MSRAELGNFAKGAALCAVLALFVWLIASDVASVGQWYQQRADERSQEYADQAESKIANSCLRLAPTKQAECVAETEEAKRVAQHDEHDLAAQKITAWWTEVMAVAAIVGMAISVVGVYLVWTTFHATKEANKISKENAWHDLKPYLALKEIDATFTADDQSPYLGFDFEIVVLNHGKTPATLKGGAVEYYLHGGDVYIPERFKLGAFRIGENRTIGPNTPLAVDCSGRADRELLPTRGEAQAGEFELIVRLQWTDYLNEPGEENLEFRCPIYLLHPKGEFRRKLMPQGNVPSDHWYMQREGEEEAEQG